MRSRPQIPAPSNWPVGFTTNYVTYFPDRILNRSGGHTSLKWAAFWHDLGYWHGAPVHDSTPDIVLRNLIPLPTSKRSNSARQQIDKQFHANLRHLGVDRWLSWLMYRAVKRFGSDNYWWTRTRESWTIA